MGLEIERKFLLSNDDWRALIESSHYMNQGYLSRTDDSAIRVRITGDQAHINVKKTTDGIQRLEYEYPIPLSDAQEMLDRVALQPVIEKTRHMLTIDGHLWEIDEFHGVNDGLIVAEIELQSTDEAFTRPNWLGKEVSEDKRYYNSTLIVHPYTTW